MSGILRVSDAASLALHALALLAKTPRISASAKRMAETMNVSEAHLAKVLQRLEKAGLVESKRGPQGGFTLNRSPENISLKQIYETIEGKVEPTHCLLGQPFCSGVCPLSDSLKAAEKKVLEDLKKTSLADFSGRLRLKKTA